MDVRTLRRALGMTLEELAEIVPTTSRSITRWEHGVRPNLTAQARLRAIRQELLPPDTSAPVRRLLTAPPEEEAPV